MIDCFVCLVVIIVAVFVSTTSRLHLAVLCICWLLLGWMCRCSGMLFSVVVLTSRSGVRVILHAIAFFLKTSCELLLARLLVLIVGLFKT